MRVRRRRLCPLEERLRTENQYEGDMKRLVRGGMLVDKMMKKDLRLSS